MNDGRSAEAAARPPKKPRDLRLDFFRGLAMFIILMAHIPGNLWTLWSPARFGFSDATEIFVFCSGFASALAFGAVFQNRGFLLGTGRILYRIWQVYWCHIGIILVAATIAFSINHFGVGEEGRNYLARPYVVPIFNNTGEALFGLLTLTYVPGLFDILPMYLVILALIPAVMAAHRYGGPQGVAVLVLGMWVAATFAGLAYIAERDGEEYGGLAAMLAPIGEPLTFLNLPSNPFGRGVWFFNPFSWQLVFFTGFAFAMGWLPRPPVNKWLIRAAAAFLILSLPFAWYKLYAYLTGWWPEGLGGAFFWDTHETLQPLWTKTWFGVFRYLHFLSLAYLAWVAVGEGGWRLREGFSGRVYTADTWRRLGYGAAGLALLTVPYGWVEEIHRLAPGLERALLVVVPTVDGKWIGLFQILHLVSLFTAIWAAMGPERRMAALGPWFLRAVPVIRKVGTQSLAVFVVSIPLAVTLGWLLDLSDKSMLPVAAANIGGGCVLIAVAYIVGWFRKQPWRGPAPAAAAGQGTDRGRTGNDASGGTVAMKGGAVAAGGRDAQPASAMAAPRR
ncbi:MAG: OpgC domain-containing protein [Pseudomonadota bacterium]